MAQIFFAKTGRSLEVEDGANLIQSLLKAGIPVASSCFGKGICTKCRLKILNGAENLSPASYLEKKARENAGESKNTLAADERLSCQTRLLRGTVVIDTSYW